MTRIWSHLSRAADLTKAKYKSLVKGDVVRKADLGVVSRFLSLLGVRVSIITRQEAAKLLLRHRH